jgi:hypothetical protein
VVVGLGVGQGLVAQQHPGRAALEHVEAPLDPADAVGGIRRRHTTILPVKMPGGAGALHAALL